MPSQSLNVKEASPCEQELAPCCYDTNQSVSVAETVVPSAMSTVEDVTELT
jgi:hypothetical protein